MKNKYEFYKSLLNEKECSLPDGENEAVITASDRLAAYVYSEEAVEAIRAAYSEIIPQSVWAVVLQTGGALGVKTVIDSMISRMDQPILELTQTVKEYYKKSEGMLEVMTDLSREFYQHEAKVIREHELDGRNFERDDFLFELLNFYGERILKRREELEEMLGAKDCPIEKQGEKIEAIFRTLTYINRLMAVIRSAEYPYSAFCQDLLRRPLESAQESLNWFGEVQTGLKYALHQCVSFVETKKTLEAVSLACVSAVRAKMFETLKTVDPSFDEALVYDFTPYLMLRISLPYEGRECLKTDISMPKEMSLSTAEKELLG